MRQLCTATWSWQASRSKLRIKAWFSWKVSGRTAGRQSGSLIRAAFSWHAQTPNKSYCTRIVLRSSLSNSIRAQSYSEKSSLISSLAKSRAFQFQTTSIDRNRNFSLQASPMNRSSSYPFIMTAFYRFWLWWSRLLAFLSQSASWVTVRNRWQSIIGRMKCILLLAFGMAYLCATSSIWTQELWLKMDSNT